MKALFAQAALYWSSRILPLAVSDSPSRPWQNRLADMAKDVEWFQNWTHMMTFEGVPMVSDEQMSGLISYT